MKLNFKGVMDSSINGAAGVGYTVLADKIVDKVMPNVDPRLKAVSPVALTIVGQLVMPNMFKKGIVKGAADASYGIGMYRLGQVMFPDLVSGAPYAVAGHKYAVAGGKGPGPKAPYAQRGGAETATA